MKIEINTIRKTSAWIIAAVSLLRRNTSADFLDHELRRVFEAVNSSNLLVCSRIHVPLVRRHLDELRHICTRLQSDREPNPSLIAQRESLMPLMLRYLNRLSDVLFALAREANAEAGREDVTW